MEIAGVGTEIIECVRIRRMIERHGEAFLRHVFTENEIRTCQGRRYATEAFAAIWAVKQAVLKCLGLGGRKDIAWMEIEVSSGLDPSPDVLIAGGCAEVQKERGVEHFSISTSYCRQYAVAFAIAGRASVK